MALFGQRSLIDLLSESENTLEIKAGTVYGTNNPMAGNANMWSEFMKFQAPAMQNMMTSYLAQSTNMFVEMQQQLQDRAKNLWSGFGFPPPNGDNKS